MVMLTVVWEATFCVFLFCCFSVLDVLNNSTSSEFLAGDIYPSKHPLEVPDSHDLRFLIPLSGDFNLSSLRKGARVHVGLCNPPNCSDSAWLASCIAIVATSRRVFGYESTHSDAF